MNEKIGKIKLELLKEEFIKQIKDSYTLNLSMVLLEEFENLQQENARLKDKIEKVIDYANSHNELEDVIQQRDLYKSVIDEIILIVKGVAYGGSEDYYIEKFKEILDKAKGE